MKDLLKEEVFIVNKKLINNIIISKIECLLLSGIILKQISESIYTNILILSKEKF